jgi:hypothetical protein
VGRASAPAFDRRRQGGRGGPPHFMNFALGIPEYLSARRT